jgi:hypothetical protein
VIFKTAAWILLSFPCWIKMIPETMVSMQNASSMFSNVTVNGGLILSLLLGLTQAVDGQFAPLPPDFAFPAGPNSLFGVSLTAPDTQVNPFSMTNLFGSITGAFSPMTNDFGAITNNIGSITSAFGVITNSFGSITNAILSPTNSVPTFTNAFGSIANSFGDPTNSPYASITNSPFNSMVLAPAGTSLLAALVFPPGGPPLDSGPLTNGASATGLPPLPIVINSITVNFNILTLRWSGGTPPFLLSRRASLTEGAWVPCRLDHGSRSDGARRR